MERRAQRRAVLAAAIVLLLAAPSSAAHRGQETTLPSGDSARILTVEKAADASAGVIVLTEGVAIKETGPKKTVARFGETYAFSPAVFAVYRDQPTLVTFRNLQPDDEHDFMLTDPDGLVLAKFPLPALEDVSYVFTFHHEGIFPFYCTLHQPTMNGQILVLPPKAGG